MVIKEIFELIPSPHVSSGKFSISSVGSCRRLIYMKMKGLYKETFDSRALRAFDLGDLFHRQAAKELLEKGEQLGIHLVAAEVPIPDKYPFLSGRCDQIISLPDGTQAIVDIKSCTDYTLDKAKQGEVPENYSNQVLLYMHLFKIPKGFILFYGKHKGEVVEAEVKYDRDKAASLLQEIKVFMEENIAKSIEPPKCDGGKFGCPVCTKQNGEK